MRKVIILFLVLVAIVGGSLGYVYWPKIQHAIKKWKIDKTEEAKDIQKTQELIKEGKPEEALAIIQDYSDAIDNHSEMGKEWLEQLIRASEATMNTSQLVLLYEYYPKSFDSHEKAALIVADYYLAAGRSKDYQALRENWKGRETKPETWFVLDGDKMLVEGKRKEAIEFLSSRTFPGKADTARLIRLALLYIFEQPKVAWDYLTQAYNKDPENSEIRSYRAKLLETVGKNNLALTEYIAAIQSDPKNIYLKDQLAEFYLRNKQYNLALQVWGENLAPPSMDFIWLKTLFWNRVVTPLKYDWTSIKLPQGKLEPLVAFMLFLKPEEFWDSSAFDKIPNNQQYLKTQQATFWLRLLQFLKDGKEKEASNLLQFNPFQSVSWNTQLEDALKRILLFRHTGKFVAETEQNPLQSESKESAKPKQPIANKDMPLFFNQLDFLAKNPNSPEAGEKMPKELRDLLTGPDAFAAAFLAAGWFEAAIQLNTQKVFPKSYPDWVPFEYTLAQRQNRGIDAALEFATVQNPTPPISLLTGELLIANKNADAALERLLPLSKLQTDIGYRASWLISLIYIDRAQYEEAKKAINSQPKLAKDILGQETLARIALLQGNNDLANKMYTSLEKDSDEAKSYLARKAFTDKDWARARDLTEQLIRKYPTNALLQENYKKILEEQNKAKSQK